MEKAVLVSVELKSMPYGSSKEYLSELAFLARSAGAESVKEFVQRLDMPDNRTYVGSGRLLEITEFVKENDIDLVIFDDDLSASQVRNLEKEFKCKILDRSGLILDIFARNAKTAQARTQVELAQMEYLLPRLTGMWTHLERQRGGIGMRGPGEREIETDRRVIRDKISRLKKKLEHIDKQSATRRKNREGQLRIALVGYTNVGKSTLMNALCKSEVMAENRLFATLDSTVRKMVLPNPDISQPPIIALLSDTVGFIRKLPHQLVESFKSTLDEVLEADLLMHVVDISHPDFENQMKVVNETLQEIGAGDIPSLVVFNKVDAYNPEPTNEDIFLDTTIYDIKELEKSWMAKENSPVVFISATENKNLDGLRSKLSELCLNLKPTY